jgi:membrane protein involved in colicin uptake
MSPAPEQQVDATIAASPLQARYGTPLDRDSAREMLGRKLDAAAAAAAKAEADAAAAKAAAEAQKAADAQAKADAMARETAERAAQKEYDRILRQTSPRTTTRRTSSGSSKTVLEQVLGSKATRDILGSVVEGIFGTRRRR